MSVGCVESRFPRLRILVHGGIGQWRFSHLAIAAPQWPFIQFKPYWYRDDFRGTCLARKSGIGADVIVEYYNKERYGTRSGCCLPFREPVFALVLGS